MSKPILYNGVSSDQHEKDKSHDLRPYEPDADHLSCEKGNNICDNQKKKKKDEKKKWGLSYIEDIISSLPSTEDDRFTIPKRDWRKTSAVDY